MQSRHIPLNLRAPTWPRINRQPFNAGLRAMPPDVDVEGTADNTVTPNRMLIIFRMAICPPLPFQGCPEHSISFSHRPDFSWRLLVVRDPCTTSQVEMLKFCRVSGACAPASSYSVSSPSSQHSSGGGKRPLFSSSFWGLLGRDTMYTVGLDLNLKRPRRGYKQTDVAPLSLAKRKKKKRSYVRRLYRLSHVSTRQQHKWSFPSLLWPSPARGGDHLQPGAAFGLKGSVHPRHTPLQPVRQAVYLCETQKDQEEDTTSRA